MSQDLSQAIESLTEKEQEAVLRFVEFLKRDTQRAVTFQAAVDNFIEQHPELLRRLAQ